MYTHAGNYLLSGPAGSHRAVHGQPSSPHVPLLLCAASLVPALCRDPNTHTQMKICAAFLMYFTAIKVPIQTGQDGGAVFS